MTFDGNNVRLGIGLRKLSKCVSTVDTRHVFEVAAALAGLKRVVRVVVEPSELAVTKQLLADLGLAVREADSFLGVKKATNLGDQWTIHVAKDDPRCAYATVFAALDPSDAAKAARQEGTADAQEIGRFLGYPECCVTNYSRIEDGSEWLTILLDGHRARSKRQQRPSHLANKIGYLFDGASFLPDYFPCSLYCAEAKELASLLREAALKCGLVDLVLETDQALKRPIIVWRGLVIQPLDCLEMADQGWAFQGETARRFDWRPLAVFPQAFLDAVGGCRRHAEGLALLDVKGAPLENTYDPSGQIIRFD